MKNRYGADGMTYNVKIDTTNGHVEFEDELDDTDDDLDDLAILTEEELDEEN